MKHWIVVFAVLAGLVGVGQVNADTIHLVTSRAALSANDYVDWGTLGVPPIDNITNPFAINSHGGLAVDVSKAISSVFHTRQQSDGVGIANMWNGNFAIGDRVLWTWDSGNGGNPITLMNFGGYGVTAVGTQFQSDQYGSFVAKVEAFDDLGVSLGAFTAQGNSTADHDNSAVFLGIRSDGAVIHQVAFSLVSAPYNTSNNFAVNRVDFAAAVPEPTTLVLWGGLSVMGLVAGVRRRFKKS